MNYKAQIDTVLHYINSQIQKDWSAEADNAFNNATSIAQLADIACLSKRNFQLMFKSYMKETVKQYVNRLRTEYGLYLLKKNVLSQKEIAEHIGWANETAFYNAFKKKFTQSPTKYKVEKFEKLHTPDIECYQIDYTLIELPETPIIFFLYQGSYVDYISELFEEDSWNKLYEYAEQNHLLSSKEEYWGICYDDCDITADEKCRFYAGLTVNNLPQIKITYEIKTMYLPKANCAVYTHKGPYDKLESFYNAILQQIPKGYDLSEGLILERYLNSIAETSEEEGLLTEVLLPVIPNLLQ